VARELSDKFNLSQQMRTSREAVDSEKMEEQLGQLEAFKNRYYDQRQAELAGSGPRYTFDDLEKVVAALAGRCAAGGATNAADLAALKLYFDCRQNLPGMINDFAALCDRLAALAGKSLAGETLTEDDAKWIENYGVALAGFHFYQGNSYEVPRDDFPLVTRVYSSPLTSRMFYAGLARPQALYVIAPGGKTLQLYRGAVMTYREFVRPNTQLLDDESWRKRVSQGQTPPAPPFTKSFYAETGVDELIKNLRAQSEKANGDYDYTENTLWQVGSRSTEKDLPLLFNWLVDSTNSEDSRTPAIAQIIGRLDWKPYEDRLRPLLASPDTILADSAAQILLTRPASLDTRKMISDFDAQPPRVQRLYCVLLSSADTPTDAAGKTLLGALRNADDGVRWQAALAVGHAHWRNGPPVAALLDGLKDANQFVAAAAVLSLVHLGSTNSAPTLLTELKAQIDSPPPSQEELQRQAKAIKKDLERTTRPVGGYSVGLEISSTQTG
jgi:HEAT repeat protein